MVDYLFQGFPITSNIMVGSSMPDIMVDYIPKYFQYYGWSDFWVQHAQYHGWLEF